LTNSANFDPKTPPFFAFLVPLLGRGPKVFFKNMFIVRCYPKEREDRIYSAHMMCRSELADWRVRPNTTLVLKKKALVASKPLFWALKLLVPIFRSHSKKNQVKKPMGTILKMQLYVKNRSELPSSTVPYLPYHRRYLSRYRYLQILTESFLHSRYRVPRTWQKRTFLVLAILT